MPLVVSIVLFVVFGLGFVFVAMAVGSVVRPRLPNPEKGAIYECGEPTVGTSWVQFDLRFYIVALVFLVFDVEVALFYPWAVAFGAGDFELRKVALVDMLFFFGVLLVGFAYLWRFGYLDWVRSAATTSLKVTYEPGIDLSREARADRPA
jgi:NADH-quinone oxidoreductase subunit A